MSPAQPPERRRAVSEGRRQDLVAAAFGQLAESGFEGLRTRDIAARAGVNVATLHYYFPTKESLVRAVLERAMGRFRTTLEPHGSPGRQLRNHLRAVARLMSEEQEVGAVMAELALRSARDREMASIMGEANLQWRTTVRNLVRRAIKKGHLPPSLDAEGVAAVIVATLSGLSLPTIGGPAIGGRAVAQLERWLGFDPQSDD